jgi:hypothetical protein
MTIRRKTKYIHKAKDMSDTNATEKRDRTRRVTPVKDPVIGDC